MSNDNPIITLRNKALLWIIIGGVFAWLSWGVYGYFTSNNAEVISHINDLSTSLELIRTEGVVTDKNWDELDIEGKKTERWNTIIKLAPEIKKLIGTGPAATKNTLTIKSITSKVGNEKYIPWLEKSWTSDAAASLEKTQSDIAEVIPVFTGISEMESTKDIAGKITLKSLNDYIQTNIVDKFGLVNAFGQIGIERVKFLSEAPEIGVYEVPLEFREVTNKNVLDLLTFLGKTGEIRIIMSGKNITIEHVNPEPTSTNDSSLSHLKNLLIAVSELSVTPSKIEGKGAPVSHVSTANGNTWDVSMTLDFYIRGASRDHISRLDANIATLLDKSGKATSLLTQGNALLKTCNGCNEAGQISDIINLLGQARTAYDSILTEERDPKKTFTPLEILSHRTELMTTLESLQKKLTTIQSVLTSSSV